MSTAFMPPSWWDEGATQPRLPVNDNALRLWILNSDVNNATTAQPSLTSPADDGSSYIIQATHTGAQWSTFDPNDVAIFFGGNWYSYAPVEGMRVSVSGDVYVYESGVWSPGGGGSAADRSTVTALSISSGVVNIDCSLGDYFTLALTANVTSITFSNLPGSGKGASIMIRITQDSTPRTVAWPASFRWEGGAGSVSTGSGAVDLLAITTLDNGTKWDATLSKGRV